MIFRLARNISRCRPMVTKGLNRAYFSVLKANYDNASRSRKLNVQNVQQAGGSRMLNVTWNNDTVGRFPFVFLRDNCQCSECFHESSVQRTYDTFNKLDMYIQPQRVEVLQNGEQISITWPERLKEQCITFLTRGAWKNIWIILNLRTVQVEVVLTLCWKCNIHFLRHWINGTP